jgi:hypothetical protein
MRIDFRDDCVRPLFEEPGGDPASRSRLRALSTEHLSEMRFGPELTEVVSLTRCKLSYAGLKCYDDKKVMEQVTDSLSK